MRLVLTRLRQVQELTIDYSTCHTHAPFSNDTNDAEAIPSNLVTSHFKTSDCTNDKDPPKWRRHDEYVHYGPDRKKNMTTICTVDFVIPEKIGPPVFFYYRLTNFYQNHRRYVKSLDTDQLKGKAISADTIKSGSCDPLRLDNVTGKPYYPCGLIANSLFNDTFSSPKGLNVKGTGNGTRTYPMTNKGIAWGSDKELYGKTEYKIDEIAVPRNWVERWPNGYTEAHPPPNLDEYEEFQVWMRTAGLPTFSKLALRNDNETMACGTYRVDIEMSMYSDNESHHVRIH